MIALASLVSADKWEDYDVNGMTCHSVTGGPWRKAAAYDKVVILLHGGGMSGMMWKKMIYDSKWLGDITGYKYVFPDALIADGDPSDPYTPRLWYQSYKNGCGLNDECAYNMTTIYESADAVKAVIAHEQELVGGDPKKVFLGGFS